MNTMNTTNILILCISSIAPSLDHFLTYFLGTTQSDKESVLAIPSLEAAQMQDTDSDAPEAQELWEL